MRLKLWAVAGILFAGITSGSAGSVEDSTELFVSGSGSRSAGLEVNPKAVERLRSADPVVKLSEVPLITGGTADFTLLEMPVFGPDTVITEMRAGGTSVKVPVPDVRTWYGTNPDHPDRALFASADADGNMKVMITGDRNTSVTVISKVPNSTGYRIEPAILPATDFCGVNNTLNTPVSQSLDERETAGSEAGYDMLHEIEMMVDIGNNLTTKLQGNGLRMLDYLTDLFGVVNVVYQRDLGTRLTIKQLTIWTTKEPFAGADTYEQLFAYGDFVRINRRNTNFDLAHYFDNNPGFGGLAWVDVLDLASADYRFAVSNLDGIGNFPADYNKYYWDSMVTAHEIGHNVGSPHTHCYNPPIDCCAADPNCKQCSDATPALGSIMSYCHLQFGNGGGIEMNFHPRCIALMQPKIAASPRIGVYPTQPNAICEGGSQKIIIPSGSLDAIPLNGTLMEASKVGAAPLVRPFILKNNGTMPLVLTGSPKVKLSGSSFIGIASQPSVSSLGPGESTTFDVQFNPFVAGTYYGVVTVPTNDPDTPNYTFGVTGRVSQPAPPLSFNWTGESAIPDGDFDGVSIPISVTGVPGTIRDVDVRFDGTDCSTTAGVGIEHPRVGELAIMLRSPHGTTCWLLQGSSNVTGANFCNTLFDDQLANPQLSATSPDAAPYTGSYRPYESLNRFAGEDANGTWQITAMDLTTGNVGTLRAASLVITGNTGSEVHGWSIYE